MRANSPAFPESESVNNHEDEAPVDRDNPSVAGILAVETYEAAEYVNTRRESGVDDGEPKIINSTEGVFGARDERSAVIGDPPRATIATFSAPKVLFERAPLLRVERRRDCEAAFKPHVAVHRCDC